MVEPPRFWPELLSLASSPRERRTQSSASAPKWSTCTLDYDAQTPANLRCIQVPWLTFAVDLDKHGETLETLWFQNGSNYPKNASHLC